MALQALREERGMQRSTPDLPAGLIAFLLNDCLYSAEVATRCVLGLADESVLRAEPGPGGALTISLAAASPLSGRALRPFEEVTLDRIRSRAARRADVPLSVLLSDDGEDYNAWRGRLADALGREGERMGLTTHAASKSVRYVLLALATVVGLITLVAYQISVKDGEVALGLGGLAVLLGLLGILFARDWRATGKGAAAAALRRQPGSLPRRLPPDPRVDSAALLPAAAAPGSGPGSAPLPWNQVWSSFGGQWHPVFVGEPARLPRRAEVRRLSLPGRATITGEVVKRWKDNSGPGDVEDSHLVCIDDGSSGQGLIFDVRESWYKQLHTGDVARVTYDPRRMSVLDIQKVP
jgi:hypothetical protein